MSNPSETRPDSSPAAIPGPYVGSERRRDKRRLMQAKATLTVLDGPGTGNVYETQMRDLSFSGVSFLLRDSISVGQLCRIDMQDDGGSYQCEIVRSRPLSNGKFEMAAQFRGPVKPAV